MVWQQVLFASIMLNKWCVMLMPTTFSRNLCILYGILAKAYRPHTHIVSQAPLGSQHLVVFLVIRIQS
jgi:hypothetical protein